MSSDVFSANNTFNIVYYPLHKLFYHFYRPQRRCGKVMFSQASAILFTGTPSISTETPSLWTETTSLWTETRSLCTETPSLWTETPQTKTPPPTETPLPHRDCPYGNERVVRILLDCILVHFIIWAIPLPPPKTA